MNFHDALKYVHEKLNEPGYYDWSLCAFMLRDYQEVKDRGLDDLAWALSKDNCSKNDLVGLLELLEQGNGDE